MHVGQSHVSSAETKRQSFVIESQQVEDGGVEVRDHCTLFDRVISQLVGGPVSLTAAYAAAGQPDAKALFVVVATVA